ncbi:GAP family protein [Mycolicibacterium smegmatis]|uniref:GAP family protein n=1 Tax=Mycolicibacterium smegmatis TaxID=1772 RepID=UPI001303035E|nr:GAP family protein [Mycolicibacterium smegmatis]
MWSAVLVLALVSAVDPVRIGITLLLIGRERPVANLLAYWLGLMAAGVGLAVIALMFLPGVVRPVTEFVVAAAEKPVIPPLQIAMGLLAIPVAVVIAMRARRRTLVAPVSEVADPVSAMAFAAAAAPVASGKRSLFSRLSWPALFSGRWGNSAAMAFAAGLFSATPPLEYCFAILAIAASGAAIGTQVCAAVVFSLVSFAIAEIPLVGYLASPVKTKAIVARMHDWIGTYRRPIFACILGLFGVLMLASGVSTI